MITRIEGHDRNSICITTKGDQDVIECRDSIIKFWLSSGTILGMEFGSKSLPNTWKINVFYGPVNKNYYHKKCLYKLQEDHYFDLDYDSEIFETDEEVLHYQIIPCTWQAG